MSMAGALFGILVLQISLDYFSRLGIGIESDTVLTDECEVVTRLQLRKQPQDKSMGPVVPILVERLLCTQDDAGSSPAGSMLRL